MLIPLFEEEIISRQKLDSEKQIDRDVIVASITPGALPVEIAASIGRRNFGTKGMILGALLMALPGAAAGILLLTFLFMMQSKVLPLIEVASVGVSAFIICLLFQYVGKVISDAKKESRVRQKKVIALIAVVFLLVCEKNIYKILGVEHTPLFAVSTLDILALAFFCIFFSRGIYSIRNIVVMVTLGGIFFLGHGGSGLIDQTLVLPLTEWLMAGLSVYGMIQNIRETDWKYENKGKEIRKDLKSWGLFLLAGCLIPVFFFRETGVFVGKGLLSSLMSFGGGDAYLTIADGLFVQPGLITESQFYNQIVPVVNVLPGSILCKTLSAVGYYVGVQESGSVLIGLLTAIAGFSASVAASCSCFMVVYHLYRNLSSLSAVRIIGRSIRPIIAGLLLNIVLSLCYQGVSVTDGFSIARGWSLGGLGVMVLGDLFLMRFRNWNTAAVVALNVAAALLVFH